MNAGIVGLWVVVGCLPCAAQAVEIMETRGKVDAVTVYRGQALVTRLVDLPGPAALREVVVTDLPEHVVPASIHAESADGIEVRSVRYRVRPVPDDVRAEVRKIDEQIRDVQDRLAANQRHKELAAEQAAYLAKLEQFVAPTANVELTKGVLNAETLKALSEFLFAQRTALAENGLRAAVEERELNAQLELFQRQRQELTGSSARTAREAVVLVNLQAAGGQLRLRYLVDSATWSPFYNIRAGADRTQVLVEYNASIQQLSGEDWTDVAMTLSTATPSLVSKAPVLTPLRVALRSFEEGKGGKAEDYQQARQRLMKEQTQVEFQRSNAVMPPAVQTAEGQEVVIALGGAKGGQGMAEDFNLNRLAGELQNLDLTSTERIARKGEKTPKLEEEVTVTYQVAARTTLPSRSDRQLIQIAPLPMKGNFYKVATPVLTGYVYEEAAFTNASDMVLLAGPVETYLAGQFVGHSSIPTIAAGEDFTVGFGIDSTLRVARELVERKETIQGANRVVDFTYRLSVENFGAQPVAVRLFDRLPKAERADIKLTLAEPLPSPLSTDAEYEHTEKKQGILRWEIDVPAGAKGLEAKALEYSFRLEYDRQMTITGLPG
jgi:hypothetical protein